VTDIHAPAAKRECFFAGGRASPPPESVAEAGWNEIQKGINILIRDAGEWE